MLTLSRRVVKPKSQEIQPEQKPAMDARPSYLYSDQGNGEDRLLRATIPPIPRDTARAAQSVLGRSNFYLITGDRLERLFQGLSAGSSMGESLRFTRNQVMLYLITIFQYLETLPDHLVPGALHQRLDWKYALHLPLNYAQLDAIVLCETRQQLFTNQREKQYFQVIIHRLATNVQLPGQPLHNLSADRLISRVCLFSRVAKTWDAINQALEALATFQPEWLLDNSLPYWFERYDPIHKTINLSDEDEALVAHAQTIGQDGAYLLNAIGDANLAGLRDIPEVIHLNKVWHEQYSQINGITNWRQASCVGCNLAAQPGSSFPH